MFLDSLNGINQYINEAPKIPHNLTLNHKYLSWRVKQGHKHRGAGLGLRGRQGVGVDHPWEEESAMGRK